MKYINILKEEVLNMSQGDLNHPMTIKSHDELSILAREVDILRTTLDSNYQNESKIKEAHQELITSLSHDLRTPLTTLRGYLDILSLHCYKDKKQMDEMAQEENYQGVIAIVPPFEYVEISDILEVAKERNEDPFVIVLDGIEDPHNLGSIIRTAETAGVHGVIIPKRRAVSVNSTVNKASAGAVEHMKIARVTNISDAIEELKKAGLWVCGTAVDTNKYYYNQDLTGPLAIVIGNEGKGIGEKVKKNCDFLVKIPMKGKVQSLNASVSTGIVVYEAVKQRIRKEN